MALPKIIVIKETESEIKHRLKTSTPFITQRLRVLLILKQHESTGLSKREAAALAGVCPDSVHKWRTIYVREGIDGLVKHNKTGYKPSVFTSDEHARLGEKTERSEHRIARLCRTKRVDQEGIWQGHFIQNHSELRVPVPMKPGQEAKIDFEHERCGVVNIFLASESLKGMKYVDVTERKTKVIGLSSSKK